MAVLTIWWAEFHHKQIGRLLENVSQNEMSGCSGLAEKPNN